MSVEYGDLRHDRPNPLSDDVSRALERLRAGATCEECNWQPASRVQRRRLLCQRCADVEHAVRSMEATHQRIRRMRKGASR